MSPTAGHVILRFGSIVDVFERLGIRRRTRKQLIVSAAKAIALLQEPIANVRVMPVSVAC